MILAYKVLWRQISQRRVGMFSRVDHLFSYLLEPIDA